MILYFGIAFFFLICFGISKIQNVKIDDRVYRWICILVSFILIIFAGTRYEIGIDYQAYKNVYEMTHIYQADGYNLMEIVYMTMKSYDAEPFYILLNALIPSYNLLLLFMAVLGVGIKCYCILQYTEHKFLWFFMYFCEIYLSYDMGVMRQGVAMSFMLLALISIDKNRNIRFILYTMIGILFQITAVLIIPLYWLRKFKINYCHMLLLSFFTAFFTIYNIGDLLLKLSQIMGLNRIEHKLSFYLSGEISYAYSTWIKTILIFLILLYGYYKNNIEKENNIYLMSYWYGLLLMEVFFSFPFLATRGTKFFYFTQLFALDRLQRKSKNGISTWLAITLLCAIYFMNLYKILPGSASNAFQGYLPYDSYLLY